jgi:hypothetical protein
MNKKISTFVIGEKNIACYKRNVEAMPVNNSANINKANDNLSCQVVEHKMAYDDEYLGLRQTQKYGGVKPVYGVSVLSFLIFGSEK